MESLAIKGRNEEFVGSCKNGGIFDSVKGPLKACPHMGSEQ